MPGLAVRHYWRAQVVVINKKLASIMPKLPGTTASLTEVPFRWLTACERPAVARIKSLQRSVSPVFERNLPLKKFTLNLDAAIVIALLVLASIGGNAYQYMEYKELKDENFRLQLQGLEDKMNLDSQENYIKRLNAKLEEQGEPAEAAVAESAAQDS